VCRAAELDAHIVKAHRPEWCNWRFACGPLLARVLRADPPFITAAAAAIDVNVDMAMSAEDEKGSALPINESADRFDANGLLSAAFVSRHTACGAAFWSREELLRHWRRDDSKADANSSDAVDCGVGEGRVRDGHASVMTLLERCGHAPVRQRRTSAAGSAAAASAVAAAAATAASTTAAVTVSDAVGGPRFDALLRPVEPARVLEALNQFKAVRRNPLANVHVRTKRRKLSAGRRRADSSDTAVSAADRPADSESGDSTGTADIIMNAVGSSPAE
jgi:hypothetical protein